MADLKNIYGAEAGSIDFTATVTTAQADRARDHLTVENKAGSHTRLRRAFAAVTAGRNLPEIFNAVTHHLPPDAGIRFLYLKNGQPVIWVQPFAGQDEPLLAYELNPVPETAYIRRIHAGPQPGQGIGTGLILSQLPFWAELGIRRVDLLAHDRSRGFYQKIGFDAVSAIHIATSVLIPMRLDLDRPEQRGRFFAAAEKTLKNPDRALKLRGIDLK